MVREICATGNNPAGATDFSPSEAGLATAVVVVEFELGVEVVVVVIVAAVEVRLPLTK
jgi:hypothetical protein